MENRIMKIRDARAREENGTRILEGYFSVFGQEYQVCPGWVETIAPGAFARCVASGADVKVLWNHDHNIVLGSTGNHTASLREDETGLFGSVEINTADQDAVNAYARIARGDVSGCSFGFEIARQEEWWDADGVYHTKILEVDPLYEVSPCTFPAYSGTSISARDAVALEKAEEKLLEARNRKLVNWRVEMRARIKEA